LGPKRLFFIGLAYTVGITIALLVPARELPRATFIPGDKVVHSAIHAVLVLLWLAFAFRKQFLAPNWKIYATVVALCLGYGIIIEIFQEWITTSRKADPLDVLANSVGTFLGLGLFLNWKRKFVR
jgi:VanZ family protein